MCLAVPLVLARAVLRWWGNRWYLLFYIHGVIVTTNERRRDARFKNRGRVPRINEGFQGVTQRRGGWGYPAHVFDNEDIIFTWVHYLFRFGAKFIDVNYYKLKIHANVASSYPIISFILAQLWLLLWVTNKVKYAAVVGLWWINIIGNFKRRYYYPPSQFAVNTLFKFFSLVCPCG